MKRASIALLVALASAVTVLGSDSFSAPKQAELPTYPARAKDARVQGAVKVWFVVDGKGSVTRAGVISGNPLLRDSALRNVKTWKFASEAMKPNTKYEAEFVYRLDVQQNPGAPKLLVAFKDGRVEVTSELYVSPVE